MNTIHTIKPKAALYFHTLGLPTDEQEVLRHTYQYCVRHNYHLQYLFKDTGLKKPIFQEMKAAMHTGRFHILCIPSLLQVHCTHMGQTLSFLKEAYDAHIEVICLYPQPINVMQQELTLTPSPSQKQPFDLGDIIRYLRAQSSPL